MLGLQSQEVILQLGRVSFLGEHRRETIEGSSRLAEENDCLRQKESVRQGQKGSLTPHREPFV